MFFFKPTLLVVLFAQNFYSHHAALPLSFLVAMASICIQNLVNKIFRIMWIKESRFQLKLVNQIFLFCNVYTSLAWFASSCFVLYYKAPMDEGSSLNFRMICFCIGFPVEVLRLYLGYSGNIRNNVRSTVYSTNFTPSYIFTTFRFST